MIDWTALVGAFQRTSRTVNVVDTTVPIITLLGSNPQIIEVGTAYAELGATATDNYDGDITASIVIDATAVNTSVLGSYFVTYNVTDSEGNAATQVTRTVTVVDTTAPVITLVGANDSPATYAPGPRDLIALDEARVWFLVDVPFEGVWAQRVRADRPKLELISLVSGLPSRPALPASWTYCSRLPGTW